MWGYTLQFIFAILVLRWPPGYEAVRWLSMVVTRFINYALDGAAVVFGDPMLVLHPFAFMVSSQSSTHNAVLIPRDAGFLK